ncbi:hypothetical protein [Phenylobacterium sp.]|jgi:hypothetical protein|uniref:hypothetical protein n=1 Tax=Phenylobacterium sp. TaxID=1871053 RepID=UPI002F405C9B
MSQPLFSEPSAPATRADLETAVRRQNEMAIRCMALENVVRGLAAWLSAALPEASAQRFIDSLGRIPDFSFDPRMPAVQAEALRAQVEREQRQLVEMIRRQRDKGPPGGG